MAYISYTVYDCVLICCTVPSGAHAQARARPDWHAGAYLPAGRAWHGRCELYILHYKETVSVI